MPRAMASSSEAPVPVSAFSHADADIIEHETPLDGQLMAASAAAQAQSVDTVYDLATTAARLLGLPGSSPHGFQRVALQFPDELLCDAVPVFNALNRRIKELLDAHNAQAQAENQAVAPLTPPQLYLLADTSYGACCVDEVAAAHVEADALIHFGHACLSRTARLPTLYVFSKLPIDTAHAAERIAAVLPESKVVALMYQVGYAHAVPALAEALAATLPHATIVPEQIDTRVNFEAKLPQHIGSTALTAEALAAPPGTSASARSCCGGGNGNEHRASGCAAELADADTEGHTRTLPLPAGMELAETDIVYLGGDSLALTALLTAHPPANRTGAFVTYDPGTGQTEQESGRGANRLLMRRYAAVQRAKDARVVALVVGTLGVAAYRPLLTALRALLTGKGSRRKVYTLAVGKLTPAKLANFAEIDTYVLVACPENSLALSGSASSANREPPGSKEFLGNIVTPFEMLVALASEAEERKDGVPGSGGWEKGYNLDLVSLYQRAVGEYQARSGRPWAVPGQPVFTAGGECAAEEEGKEEEEEEEEAPIFSLATGKYVTRTAYYTPSDLAHRPAPTSEGPAAGDGGTQVALRRGDGTLTRVLDTASGARNPDRAWAGLDPRVGLDPPAPLEEGRAGYGRQYAYADQTPEGNN